MTGDLEGFTTVAGPTPFDLSNEDLGDLLRDGRDVSRWSPLDPLAIDLEYTHSQPGGYRSIDSVLALSVQPNPNTYAVGPSDTNWELLHNGGTHGSRLVHHQCMAQDATVPNGMAFGNHGIGIPYNGSNPPTVYPNFQRNPYFGMGGQQQQQQQQHIGPMFVSSPVTGYGICPEGPPAMSGGNPWLGPPSTNFGAFQTSFPCMEQYAAGGAIPGPSVLPSPYMGATACSVGISVAPFTLPQGGIPFSGGLSDGSSSEDVPGQVHRIQRSASSTDSGRGLHVVPDVSQRLTVISGVVPSMMTPLHSGVGGRGHACLPGGGMRRSDLMVQGSRAACLERYRQKKARRSYVKHIRYHMRKVNADRRPRVKGRFIKADIIEVSQTIVQGCESIDSEVP